MRSRLKHLPRAAALLSLVLLSAALIWHNADPVAIVVQVNGQVQVQRVGQSAPAPAAIGMRLMAGDRVVVPTGGRAVLLHQTGRMETAVQSIVVPTPPPGRAPSGLFAQTVKTLAQVATTDARSQPNRQGMIRPIAGAAVGIAPRNDLHVLQSRPTITWFRVPEASGYVIQVHPVGGKPIRYTTGPDTMWALPASEPALADETTYEWRVAALPSGRPSAPQRFRTASAEQRAMVSRAIEQLSNAGEMAQAGALPRAIAYMDAGFLYDAWSELEELRASGAPISGSVHLLRADLLNRLGNVDAATRELDLATRAGS